ncbi:MAG: DUF885 domain-containing protein [Alphaproteobacteria bacterium]
MTFFGSFRHLILFAAASLFLGLAACGQEDGKETQAPAESAAPEAAQTGDEAKAPADDEAQGEDARLAAFFEDVWQRNLSRNPLLQTQLGLKTDYGKCPDLSEEFAIEGNELTRRDLETLRNEFDVDALSPSSRLSYRLFEYNAEQELEAFEYRHLNYPVHQMFAITTGFPTMLINFHRVDTKSDAEAYISRLQCSKTMMEQTVDNMRLRAEKGVVPPEFTFDYVLKDTKNIVTGAPFDVSGTDSPLWEDFKRKVAALDIAEEEKQRLLDGAKAALTGPMLEGYNAFLDYEAELKKSAEGNKGVWALPGGEAYYRHQVARSTTTDMDPDTIHELGLAEVSRLKAEMEDIRSLVEFEGSLDEFFEHVRTRPENFYPDTDEGREQLLADANAMIDGINSKVDGYFNLLPKAGVEVKPVEKFREDTAGIAFYNRPSKDGSRPGYYYINLKDMSAVPRHTLEAITYHEAVPGHHFQIALMQEHEDLPMFRRFGGYNAYVEGWALYAEQLAKEMGFYEDPYSDFGRLSTEMWRAVRLVVDTGIHAKKWTRQEAIDYMSANVPIARSDVVKEIERYFVVPGQALGYKVGMMKILELRDLAREELGENFDIRDFHDVVLGGGALPLAILENRVRAYIAERKGGR